MSDPDVQLEQALLEAALGLSDGATRARFLDRACGGDSALRARLDQLLEDHVKAERFFDFNLELPTSSAASASPENRASAANDATTLDPAGEPTRIGRYRIVRRL